MEVRHARFHRTNCVDDRFEQIGRFLERLLGLPAYDRNGSIAPIQFANTQTFDQLFTWLESKLFSDRL